MLYRTSLRRSNSDPSSAQQTKSTVKSRLLKKTMVSNEATAEKQDFPSNGLSMTVLERLLGNKVLKLLCEFLLQITMVYCYHDKQRRITTDRGKHEKHSYLFPFQTPNTRQIYDVLVFTQLLSCLFICVFFQFFTGKPKAIR